MIYLGADHRGFELKEKIKQWLGEWGEEYEDMGNEKYDKSDDYVDYAKKVGEKVGEGRDKGILICGSGVGVNVVVNKYKGVRGMMGLNEKQVKHGIGSDKVNVLSLASNHVVEIEAKNMIKSFLETQFKGEERHLRRLEKIKKIEEARH